MNENIDLTKILKNCPEGTTFWSDNYGEVQFKCIIKSYTNPINYPILVKRSDGHNVYYTKEGWHDMYFPASCLLWPSKDQRDWSKFTAPWLKKEPEHKFHEGDWVVYNNDICQIVKREEGCNKLVTVFGIEKELVNERNLSTARLWTIEDAKDGDVLATSAGPFIYNGNNGGGSCPGSYCGINTLDSFQMGIDHHWIRKRVYPATKEQRDLLFQIIKELGYKWNVETKTLEKLVEHKFDPKTLKPFDKVLVRDSHNAVWFCKWFSHIMDLSKFYKYATTGCLYRYCIPYNDDTKHLVGTNEEAPKYYRYWED